MCMVFTFLYCAMFVYNGVLVYRAMERRYQEQLRQLNSEQDKQQQAVLAISQRQKARLEQLIERLKDEEARLKEKLAETQKVRGQGKWYFEGQIVESS